MTTEQAPARYEDDVIYTIENALERASKDDPWRGPYGDITLDWDANRNRAEAFVTLDGHRFRLIIEREEAVDLTCQCPDCPGKGRDGSDCPYTCAC